MLLENRDVVFSWSSGFFCYVKWCLRKWMDFEQINTCFVGSFFQCALNYSTQISARMSGLFLAPSLYVMRYYRLLKWKQAKFKNFSSLLRVQYRLLKWKQSNFKKLSSLLWMKFKHTFVKESYSSCSRRSTKLILMFFENFECSSFIWVLVQEWGPFVSILQSSHVIFSQLGLMH